MSLILAQYVLDYVPDFVQELVKCVGSVEIAKRLHRLTPRQLCSEETLDAVGPPFVAGVASGPTPGSAEVLVIQFGYGALGQRVRQVRHEEFIGQQRRVQQRLDVFALERGATRRHYQRVQAVARCVLQSHSSLPRLAKVALQHGGKEVRAPTQHSPARLYGRAVI